MSTIKRIDVYLKFVITLVLFRTCGNLYINMTKMSYSGAVQFPELNPWIKFEVISLNNTRDITDFHLVKMLCHQNDGTGRLICISDKSRNGKIVKGVSLSFQQFFKIRKLNFRSVRTVNLSAIYFWCSYQASCSGREVCRVLNSQ